MLDDFLVRAALGALGVALAAALLGCFVVWRRMAYFGDATAHASILGVALSLGLGLPPAPGILATAGATALLVWLLAERGIGADAVLGVIAHGALGLGLFAAAVMPGPRMNLDAWLFGDILTVGRADLLLIWGGAALVAGLVRWHWGLLLTSTLSPDLARAAGMDPRRGGLLLSLLLAVVVAVAIQVVGALLVIALLIIPAAAARGLARTPEGMAWAACAIGAGAALGGLGLAVLADAGVGPSIVTVAVVAFGTVTAGTRLRGG
jgi:zinc transport system permease protein